jgi:hypothetical protein
MCLYSFSRDPARKVSEFFEKIDRRHPPEEIMPANQTSSAILFIAEVNRQQPLTFVDRVDPSLTVMSVRKTMLYVIHV